LRSAIIRCTCDCAANRIDDARKFDQEPVAGGFDDMAAVLGDLGVRDFAADRLQCRKRALLVGTHQPRVAGDIGREDRHQPPLDPLSPGVHARDASAIFPFTIAPEQPGSSARHPQRAPFLGNAGSERASQVLDVIKGISAPTCDPSPPPQVRAPRIPAMLGCGQSSLHHIDRVGYRLRAFAGTKE
jgi:hypothetical protein